jgi:pimeloyl-ACP methyl ester carboxylesterase
MEAPINGIRTHYVDLGDRSALPVVLIHGMSFDHEMWLPQIELLSGKWESRIP